MPINPSSTPAQRCQRGRSPKSHGASTITKSGAIKFIAVPSASGTMPSTLKKSKVVAIISTARCIWRGKECVLNRLRPRRGSTKTPISTTCPT